MAKYAQVHVVIVLLLSGKLENVSEYLVSQCVTSLSYLSYNFFYNSYRFFLRNWWKCRIQVIEKANNFVPIVLKKMNLPLMNIYKLS